VRDGLGGSDFAFLSLGLNDAVNAQEPGIYRVGHKVNCNFFLRVVAERRARREMSSMIALHVSVKVLPAVPMAIAPALFGSSVVNVSVVWCLVTSTHAAVSEERRACRVVLPRAASKW
jgi:hypothetical protein